MTCKFFRNDCGCSNCEKYRTWWAEEQRHDRLYAMGQLPNSVNPYPNPFKAFTVEAPKGNPEPPDEAGPPPRPEDFSPEALKKAVKEYNASKGPVYIEHPIVGVKADSTKPRFSLLPWASVLEVVKVLEFGAAKYAEDNWQKVPDASRRYFDAAMRHMVAWREGETLDPESGFHHLAHATCCLLFMLWFEVKS